MAETGKKAKTAAAPRKPKATKANGANGAGQTAAAPVVGARLASHDEIRALAHKYWAERGHPHGNPEHDWFRAEQELRGKAS
ncbi:MAG TPA: DUF2934 domain-containing protein [Acidobacteriaceae bacterium]|jgi:hypothetical protein|nr:DUF2934 domain-containing protein [Acidobacteriaceae bacterium]